MLVDLSFIESGTFTFGFRVVVSSSSSSFFGDADDTSLSYGVLIFTRIRKEWIS